MNATILCYTWDWTAVGGCSQACYPGGRKGLYLRSVPRCHDCLFTGRVITSICNDLFFRVFCVGNKQIVMPDTNIFFFFKNHFCISGTVILVSSAFEVSSWQCFKVLTRAIVKWEVGWNSCERSWIDHSSQERMNRTVLHTQVSLTKSLQTLKFDELHLNLKYQRENMF